MQHAIPLAFPSGIDRQGVPIMGVRLDFVVERAGVSVPGLGWSRVEDDCF